MPNKMIYWNTVDALEKDAGISLIDRASVEKTLQEAWEKDETAAKVNFLDAYRQVFQKVLQTWAEKETEDAYVKISSDATPNFQKCLLETDRALKKCALALIPGLRTNEDILFNMTFGSIEPHNLMQPFSSMIRLRASVKTAENTAKKRVEKAGEKYIAEWQTTPTRRFTGLVWDKDAVALMSEDEKIDYLIALQRQRASLVEKNALGEMEKPLYDDAIEEWKKEIGIEKGQTIEDYLGALYFQKGQTFGNTEWLQKQTQNAVTEYNKLPDQHKALVEEFKRVDSEMKQEKRQKEGAVKNEGVSEESAEAVADLFAALDMEQDLQNRQGIKEDQYFDEAVQRVNQRYGVRISRSKMQNSIKEVTKLMMEASDEKRQFLDPNNVVVIENGVEKAIPMKEYFKDILDEAEKKRKEETEKLDKEKKKLEEDKKLMATKLEEQKKINEPKTHKILEKSAKEAFDKKAQELATKEAEIENAYKEKTSSVKGGFVFEKDGDQVRRYKASEYYETHETKKERYAYGEHQKMYARAYQDAIASAKELGYPEGKLVNPAVVAKDIQKMFERGMFMAGAYESKEPHECIARTAYGGFTSEQLAAMAMNSGGQSWKENQTSNQAFNRQLTGAKRILAQWQQKEKTEKGDPALRITGTLGAKMKQYESGKLSRKSMLDYVLAADAHIATNYSTRTKRFFNFIRHKNERRAVEYCKERLGIGKNGSLRAAMNREYSNMASHMSKELAFKWIDTARKGEPGYETTRERMFADHDKLKEKMMQQRQAELDKLRVDGREPISIPALDERKVILHQEPRVQPIKSEVKIEQVKNLNA